MVIRVVVIFSIFSLSILRTGLNQSVVAILLSSQDGINSTAAIPAHRRGDEFYSTWIRAKEPLEGRKFRLKYLKDSMDLTIDPCDDFYQYACGNWGKINPNPKNYSKHSTIEVLHRRKLFALKKILLSTKSESLSSARSESESEMKAKSFYQSCVNLEQLRLAGSKPLVEFLSNFASWPAFDVNWSKNKFDLIEVIGRAKLFGTDTLFIQSVDVDYENELSYFLYLDQVNLPLDQISFGKKNELNFYKQSYNKTMQKILRRLGISKKMVSELTQEVSDFEMKLCSFSSKEQDRQDTLRYRRLRISQLHDEIPQVDWQRYFSIVQNRTVSFSEIVIIKEFDYLQNLGKLISQTSVRTLANYIFWRLALKYTSYTHIAATLTRNVYEWWMFCISEVMKTMKSPVNALFIKNYFNNDVKREVLSIIEEIREVTRDAIHQTQWFDDDVKQEAERKLAGMSIKVGYPDYILSPGELDKDYASMKIDKTNFFSNAIQLSHNLNRIEQRKVGTAVNKTEWFKSPIEVGAFLEFQRKGELIVPAGILQSPVYSEYVPVALNYGSIGTIIGHELMHAFDVASIIYNDDDYTSDLWTPEIDREYNLHIECYLEQYNQYKFPNIDKRIDGDQTLIENIADNDGLKVAFKAYKKWFSNVSHENSSDLEFTNNQLLFISFAQNWCDTSDPQQILKQIETDEHSPEKFRVIGVLSNFKEFSKEFQCPAGSTMNPIRKCEFLNV